jgi:hypothetical protein
MLTFLSKRRRAAVAEEALRSRADRTSLIAAMIVVAVYNLIGVIDVYSTAHGLAHGVAEEANPVMRAAMDHFGVGWIAAKLALQLLISAMVLWFPHRIVLAIFLVAVAFNAGVVYSNLKIVGLV